MNLLCGVHLTCLGGQLGCALMYRADCAGTAALRKELMAEAVGALKEAYASFQFCCGGEHEGTRACHDLLLRCMKAS